MNEKIDLETYYLKNPNEFLNNYYNVDNTAEQDIVNIKKYCNFYNIKEEREQEIIDIVDIINKTKSQFRFRKPIKFEIIKEINKSLDNNLNCFDIFLYLYPELNKTHICMLKYNKNHYKQKKGLAICRGYDGTDIWLNSGIINMINLMLINKEDNQKIARFLDTLINNYEMFADVYSVFIRNNYCFDGYYDKALEMFNKFYDKYCEVKNDE